MEYDDLVRQGNLKREERLDWQHVERLLARARKDLEIAKKTLKIDEPTALDLVYKSMFHAANALIRSQGYRPGRVRQHLGVIEAVERTLGVEARPMIRKFNQLRQKRNEFEYQGLYRSSKTEIQNGFQDAGKLIEVIGRHLRKKNPQGKIV